MRNFIKILGQIVLVVSTLLFLVWFFGKDLVEKEFAVSFEPGLGRDIFRIITGQKGPKFTLIAIEPKDVKPGDVQKLTVKVEDPSGVTAVTAQTELDRSTFSLPLKLREGDANSGSWTNIWFVNDTHSKIYRTKFIAQNSKGETSNITLAWSDSCTPPYDGAWTVAASCTITNVVGADRGNIDLGGAYTLTINAGGVLVYNSGYSITLGTGSIALNTTGTQIAQANLFITDNDNDGYANSAWARTYSTASSLTNYVRQYTLATIAYDCDDTNSIVQINRTQYTDGDSDGYAVSGATICASASSWGDATCAAAGSNYMKNSAGSCVIASSLSGTDCNDANANIYQNIGSLGTDADQDGYYTGTLGTQCVGPSTAIGGRTYYRNSSGAYTWLDGGALGGSDCADSASNVYPTNPNWYTASGANGWDYNCSAATEYQYGLKSGTCAGTCGAANTFGAGFGANPGCGAAGTYYTGCPSGCSYSSGRSDDPTVGWSLTSASYTQGCH